MREAVVVASSRTPLAKSFRGSFNMTRPDDLLAHVLTDVLGKVPELDPTEVEDIIAGKTTINLGAGRIGAAGERIDLARAAHGVVTAVIIALRGTPSTSEIASSTSSEKTPRRL